MNIGGYVLSVVAYIIVGMLWYSPALFGTTWMKITGMRPEKIDKEKMNVMYGLSALAALVTAIIIDYLQVQFDVQSLQQALTLGFLLWLGFTLTSIMVVNMYEGRSKKLTLIDSGYQLATILISSVIMYFL